MNPIDTSSYQEFLAELRELKKEIVAKSRAARPKESAPRQGEDQQLLELLPSEEDVYVIVQLDQDQLMHIAEKGPEEEEEIRWFGNRGAAEATEPLKQISGLENVASAAEDGLQVKQGSCGEGRLCGNQAEDALKEMEGAEEASYDLVPTKAANA